MASGFTIILPASTWRVALSYGYFAKNWGPIVAQLGVEQSVLPVSNVTNVLARGFLEVGYGY